MALALVSYVAVNNKTAEKPVKDKLTDINEKAPITMRRVDDFQLDQSCTANIDRMHSFRNLHDWNHRNQIQPEAEKCYDAKCENYRGYQDTSVSGKTCQPWEDHKDETKDY